MKTKRAIGKNQRVGRRWLFLFSLLAGISVLGAIIYGLSKEVLRQRKINREVAALEEEIERLSHNNQDLRKLAEYLQTDEFKEKEVRDKLNLVKKGEKLILVKEKEIREEKMPVKEKTRVFVNRPKYYYWWQYYFGWREEEDIQG